MGFSIPHLFIVLLIVILVFGTKKVKSLGFDLGEGIKSFRQALKDSQANGPSD